MSSRRERGAALVQLVSAGHASARLLQHPVVIQQLKASQGEEAERQIAELTSSLPPLDADVQRLVTRRLKNFSAAQASPAEPNAIR